MRYIVGVSVVLWSVRSSIFLRLVLIAPFIGYILLILSKINVIGVGLNEVKKVLLSCVVTSFNLIVVVVVIWIVKGVIGFVLIGGYVLLYMVGGLLFTSGVIFYLSLKNYKLLIWGVLPLPLFLMKINMNIIIVSYVLLGVLIV
jgi:hypothetical protein